MYNITIISSFHKVYGKCNTDELYKIIEQLQPDVIFEELSYQDFEIIYSPYYQPQTIEAITIKKYIQQYPIRHFPVDNFPVNETDLLSDAQIFLENNNEYGQLWSQILIRLYQSGYYFVNSDECIDILNKLKTIEESVLTVPNNVMLLKEYNKEKSLHDIRENEMLSTIYNYAIQYPFENAIFICGANHRQSIKNKIKDFETKISFNLNWTFFNEYNYD